MFVKDRVGGRTFLMVSGRLHGGGLDVNLHVVNSLQRILMYANPLSWCPALKAPVMTFF